MKRSSNEQLPDNQKRYNTNGISYPAPSPPLQPNMYMNQYYPGNTMQYPDYMSMMNQNYSMYSPSNQVVWSQSPQPGPSSVMFNCAQPPPPLPKEPTPKPPPPPPDGSSNSTQSYNSRYGGSHFSPPRPPGPRNNNNPSMQQMRQTRGAGRGGGGNYPRPDRGGHKRQPYSQRGFNPGQNNSSPNGQRFSKPQKHQNEPKSDNSDENKILVNKKAKRKPMSTRYTRKREWDRGDAIKAITLEKEYNRLQRTAMLILKFPDPEISKDLVKKYSPFINSVHFQQPATPRYCFVQLKDGADIEKVRQQISQVPFGSGFVTADKKKLTYEDHSMITPEEIDPYTLYIGNLPTTVSVAIIKKNFPKALRIDIGYAQRLKYTRYAFIRYNTVEDAMEAYKETFNLLIESRSLIVRFRRQRGNVGLPGELKTQNPTKTGLTPDEENKMKETLKKKESENTIDSKKHVLEEAADLMHKMAKTNNSNELSTSVAVKSEKSTDPISKETNNIVDGEVDEYDHVLLGTKVKDEPPDEDDFNDDVVHHYFDDPEEDELDMLPEEEDDIVDEDYGLHEGEDEDEVDDDDVATFGYHHWEEVRRRELDMKEEKPDISLLPPIGNKKKKDHSNLLKENKEDDLDDLFNRMNPDNEDSV